jgi:hypothetical protein
LTKESFATELADVPQMDTGAPFPIVLASGSRVVLSYLLATSEHAPQCAVVTFERPRTHSLGSPGDETLHGHPLYGKGLTFYAAFRVSNSESIKRLQAIDSVHRLHKPESFQSLSHFIFTFHDSTFECVAHSMAWQILNTDDLSTRIQAMTQVLPPEGRIFIRNN